MQGSRTGSRAAGRALLVGGLLLAVTACNGKGGSSAQAPAAAAAASAPKPIVRMGTAESAESELLTTLFAEALESRGYQVSSLSGGDNDGSGRMSGGDLMRGQLKDGDIDAYVGYAADELADGLDQPVFGQDLNAVMRQLTSLLEDQGMDVLAPSPAADPDALAVSKATAGRLGLATMSDLVAHASSLVLGAPANCDVEPHCVTGLKNVYGLSFAKVTSLTPGRATIDALVQDQVQAAVVQRTDGDLGGKDVVLLKDDKDLHAGENVVVMLGSRLVRDETVRTVWDAVSRQLTTDDLFAMNKRVEVDGVSVESVVHDWLKAHKLPK